jgi:hypothetical protein
MLVPEAAMHKNDALNAAKRQIGSSWKCLNVKAVSVPQFGHKPPYEQFGPCILVPDLPHIF